MISVDTNWTTELQKFGKSGCGKRRYGQVSGFRGGTGKKSRGEESFPPPKNFSLRTKTLKILKFISKKKKISSCQKKIFFAEESFSKLMFLVFRGNSLIDISMPRKWDCPKVLVAKKGRGLVWRLSGLANLEFSKFWVWRVVSLVSTEFGNFRVWQLQSLATLEFGNLRVWQLCSSS